MSKVTRTFTLPDGRRKYIRADSIEEAEKIREEMKEQAAKGLRIGENPTVAELAQIWFDTYKKDQLHIRSEESIESTLRCYILPFMGRMKAKDVTPVIVQQLMNSVRKYSKSTQKKVLQHTRSIFQMAVEENYIEKSPVRKSLKAKGSDPDEKIPLTHEQSDALLASVEGTRAYPLVLLLLYTGLRIGEALGLMWSDVDFEEGTITVNRSIVYPTKHQEGLINEEMKTEAAHRTIPVPDILIDVLKEERANSKSVFVFAMQNGSHMSAGSYRSLWRLIDYRTVGRTDSRRELIDRSLDFRVHPHLLRHTCITRWFEAGLDIKEVQHLAGHTSPELTLQIYTHYMAQERRKETAKKIRAIANLSATFCNKVAT